MKSSIKLLFLTIFCCILTLSFAGCNSSEKSDSSSETVTSSVSESSTSEASSEELTGLWSTAVYTEDTEVGEGAKTVSVEVSAEDKSITFTIHTDKENLADALTDNKLVSGDESEYGLYIKEVNGIKADYDVDKAYWAISKDGEYLNTGADSTTIADGEHYELTYTKG